MGDSQLSFGDKKRPIGTPDFDAISHSDVSFGGD